MGGEIRAIADEGLVVVQLAAMRHANSVLVALKELYSEENPKIDLEDVKALILSSFIGGFSFGFEIGYEVCSAEEDIKIEGEDDNEGKGETEVSPN